MELQELKEKTLNLFKISSVENLGQELMKTALSNNYNVFEKFLDNIDGDLNTDYLQMIYQYYQADRIEKMQDYTPKSLSKLVAKLSKSKEIIDMCAGSGALTIQNWIDDKNRRFILYEFDKNVIPFLLFNLSLRNISSIVYQKDVLSGEVFKKYTIQKGEKFGMTEEIKNEDNNF